MNRNYLTVLTLLVSITTGFSAVSEYDKEIKEYKKQITAQSSELEKIEKELELKKFEKEKYRTEEENIRKKLNLYNVQMKKLNKDIAGIESDIRATKNNLEEARRNLKLSTMEISQLKELIGTNLDHLYREKSTIYTFFDDPWFEKLELYMVEDKIQLVSVAERRKMYAELSQEKYTRVEKELAGLYKQLESKYKQQTVICKEQNELLKTTVVKRTTVEEDMKQLSRTAEEIQQLLESLEQKKQQTIEQKKQEELAKKQFKEKKHYLAWPVIGKVVQSFGKTKHPELDTYVISNGIKIETEPYTEVLAVDKGEVVYASNFRSYGKTVIIDHGGGTYTVYGNLGEISVNENKKVTMKSIIGKTSGKGILYFEMRIDNNPEDPVTWLMK